MLLSTTLKDASCILFKFSKITMEICNVIIAYHKLMHFFVKSNSTKLGIKVEKI